MQQIRGLIVGNGVGFTEEAEEIKASRYKPKERRDVKKIGK